MKYAFIKQNRSEISVKKMCSYLEVSQSGYYDWLDRKPAARTVENEKLLTEIRTIYKKNRGVYGSPRIADALNENREEGDKISENRVAGIMKKAGISAEMKKKFRIQTTDSNHDFAISPNLLKQNFATDAPNQIWVSDITYIRTGEGFGYLCAIKDLYDEKIIGWSFDDHMKVDLVLEALRKAVLSREISHGLIFHSDRGVQYASEEFRSVLKFLRIKQSMSRKGNCYDNAPMESFFGRLKVEEVYRNKYKTFYDAKRNLFDYIEGFYNRKRKHSKLKYLSPHEFMNL